MESKNTQLVPFIGLSPMDGVTDAAFRQVVKEIGNPNIMFTEFTSAEGISKSAEKLMLDFLYDETQRPIIAQLFGYTPEAFRIATIVVCELGFDGVDINMGCPAKSIAQKGGGASLITQPELAKKIMRAVKQGILEWKEGIELDALDLSPDIKIQISERHAKLPLEYQQRRLIPFSIKTRTGYDQHDTNAWISTLLEEQPYAISLHGRTYKQMYGGEANWEEIAKASQLVKETSTRIYGNGDIHSYQQAMERIQQYDLDGVLIGRAAMGNPWVFVDNDGPVTWEERKIAIFKHLEAHKHFYNATHFLSLRKHLGWYVKDIPHASEIRQQLYRTNTYQEVENILRAL